MSSRHDRPRRRRRRDPAAVDDLLRRWRARGPRPPAGAGEDLAGAWARAAGRHGEGALPIRRSRNGVVTVACTDAGRAQEVAARSGELALALAREAGVAVTGLRVVIADHVQPPSTAPPRPTPPPEPGADARAAASGIAGSVEDAELRGYLERAAALSLDRRWREGPAGR